MKILYIGQFNDACGYGNAARKYINVLLKDEFFQKNLVLLPVNAEKRNFANENDTELIKKYSLSADKLQKFVNEEEYVTIVHFLPTIYGNGSFIDIILQNSKKNYSIVYTEVDRVPEKWQQLYKESGIYHEIITASKWNQDIFSRDTGLKTHLIYLPFEKKDIEYNHDEKFTIFSMSQWVPRKGFDCVIKAYIQEFFNNIDTRLIIKTYRHEVMNNSSEENEKQIVLKEAQDYKKQVFHHGKNSDAEVYIVTGHIPEEQVQKLYSKSNIFCSGAKAEGFGITLADACMYGIPCIALKYTGHVDFLNNNESFLYDGTLSPVNNDSFYLVSKDMNLYEPNILDMRKNMRKAYEIWKEDKIKLKNIGAHNREYAMNVLDPQKTLNKFKEIFKN